jgi:hypothetical protein|tara:strand:- start:506 stop:1153 length:648 start_codon:yes stop_codon:yes gene_type:complete
MRNHYKRALFPVTLYHTNVRENSVIQREILSSIQKCYEEKELPIPNGWLTDKLTTSFDQDELNHKIFESEKIHELYMKYVSSIFDKPVSFSLEDMWFNYYIDGEYQEEHHHINPTPFLPPVHFSCVHYLKYDEEEHVPTTFHDPISTLRCHSFEIESNYYREKWSPKVKEGDLLIFPSYLVHHVEKSKPTPDNPRITVAFNLRLLTYGDEGKDQL